MSQTNLDVARAFYGRGKLDQAETAFRQILASGSANADAHYGLGLIALDRNKPEDAAKAFKLAINAKPTHLDALLALGVAFMQAGHAAKATTILVEAVKQAPHLLEPHLHLVRAFTAADRPDEALRVLEQAIEDFPHSAEVWVLKGRIERSAGLAVESYASFQKAVGLEPDNPKYRNDLGVACRAIDKSTEAEQHYRVAIGLHPGLAVAHANLGNVLDLLGDTDTAEKHLRQAIAYDPDTPDASYNLACLLTKLERPEDSLPLFESLALAEPDRWDIQTNLGVTYLAVGNLAAAEIALRNSIRLKPGNPEAHYNLAWLLLLQDQHAEGWSELEWRWQLPEFSAVKPDYKAPAWDGSVESDATLLLHAEQGLGDTIQFVRFAALAKDKVARIILRCQPPLVRLLEGLTGVDQVASLADPAPAVDVYATMVSLPKLLNHDGSSALGARGYLQRPTTIEDRITVPNRGKRRIGFVWAGSPDNKIERRRKVAPDLFLPLFGAVDADFIALQVGPAAADLSVFPQQRISFDCNTVVSDFADTAAVISQLDLVIGVDTSVVHLAGSLGVPVWVFLPYMPDYRWGLGRDTTPWYDSMRLFRQPQRGDWAAVIREMCKALRSW